MGVHRVLGQLVQMHFLGFLEEYREGEEQQPHYERVRLFLSLQDHVLRNSL